jgi:hypothetical protein
MDSSHLRKVIQSGEWCVKYHSSFVKQNNKTQKSGALVDKILVGRPVTIDDHLLGRLERFAERPGWHTEDGVVIHVARSAKSLRTPRPRHDPKSYPLRSSYARFDLSNGDSEWRQLDDRISYMDLPQRTALIGQTAAVLVTFFRVISSQQRNVSAVNEGICHG